MDKLDAHNWRIKDVDTALRLCCVQVKYNLFYLYTYTKSQPKILVHMWVTEFTCFDFVWLEILLT